MRIFRISILLIILLLISFTFRNWFLVDEIIGGDWPYYSPGLVSTFNFTPPIWSEAHANGLGGTILSYGIDTYMRSTGTIFHNIFGIPWPVVYKFCWFLMFIVVSFVGAILLVRKIVDRIDLEFALLAGLIFSTNSYILMVVGGGQMGVAIAYAIFPIVILHFINLLEANLGNKKDLVPISLTLGASLSLQTLFDPRIAYLSLILITLSSLFSLLKIYFFSNEQFPLYLKSIFTGLVLSLSMVILLNAFWLIPLILVQQISQASIGVTASVSEVLSFYSFANFANSFSLLHPNWPENIFGKVAFMRPEFIILPLLAFLSFVIKYKNKYILSFSLLALIGAFLSKGSNPPLGLIYELLFTYVPGFIVFRDPTKFYMLIALSYSILIPYSLYLLGKEFTRIKISDRFKFRQLLTILFLIFWGITLRSALSTDLNGTFHKNSFALEYKELRSLINSDDTFSRTLWVPRQSRLADPTNLHPVVEAFPLFNATSTAAFSDQFNISTTQERLSALGIKYVILPSDPYGEMFLDDRKYSETQRLEFKKILDSTPYLKKIQDDKISIYQLSSHNGLFTSNQKRSLNYERISDTEYRVEIAGDTLLIFSQNYHPQWNAFIGSTKISPIKTPFNTMQFTIPKNYSGELTIIFEGKYFYTYSLLISITTLIFLVTSFIVLKLKNYEKV